MRSPFMSNPTVQRSCAETAEEFYRRTGERISRRGILSIERRALKKIRKALLEQLPSIEAERDRRKAA